MPNISFSDCGVNDLETFASEFVEQASVIFQNLEDVDCFSINVLEQTV